MNQSYDLEESGGSCGLNFIIKESQTRVMTGGNMIEELGGHSKQSGILF